MKECPECNAINNDNAILCLKCGASFINEHPHSNSCVHCGNELSKQNKSLCKKCSHNRMLATLITTLSLYIVIIGFFVSEHSIPEGILFILIMVFLASFGISSLYFKNPITYENTDDTQQYSEQDKSKYKDVEKDSKPSPKKEEYIFCPECNAMNSEKRVYCLRCGILLKDIFETKDNTEHVTTETEEQHPDYENPTIYSDEIVNEYTIQRKFKIAGVTFDNRQENLKQLYSDILSKKQIKVGIRKYLYKGNPAFKIFANGLDIGNIPQKYVFFFNGTNQVFKPVKLYINYFYDRYDDLIFYARIYVNFYTKIYTEYNQSTNKPNNNKKRMYSTIEDLVKKLDNINDGHIKCERVLLSSIKECMDNSTYSFEDVQDTEFEIEAYKLIYSFSFDLLCSGQFHVYRGVLNELNESTHLMKICKKCLDYACKIGSITEDERKEQLEILRDEIRCVG